MRGHSIRSPASTSKRMGNMVSEMTNQNEKVPGLPQMLQHEINPMKTLQATDTPEMTDMRQTLHQQAKEITEIRQNLEQQGDMIQQLCELMKMALPNIEYISRTVGRLTTWERLRPERRETTPRPRHRANQAFEHRASPEDKEISKQDAHLPEVLQENISMFVKNIYIDDMSLADELLTNDCITDDEYSVLATKLSPEDKVRYLIRTIKRKTPHKISKFVEILGKDYPYLKDAVNSSCSQKAKEKRVKEMCLCCKIKTTVDLRDIMDDLWRHKIIDDDLYDNIIDWDPRFCNQSSFWERLFIHLNTSSVRVFARDILIKSLETKYQHISTEIKCYEEATLFCQCRTLNMPCLRLRPLRTDSISGSMSDLSTTTDEPRVPRFERLQSSSEPSSDEEDLNLNSMMFADVLWNQSKSKATVDNLVHELSKQKRYGQEANQLGISELIYSEDICNDLDQRNNKSITSRGNNEKLSKETKSAMDQVEMTDNESDASSASSSPERPCIEKSISVITVIANTASMDDSNPPHETQNSSDQTEEKEINIEEKSNQKELTHYQRTSRKTKRRNVGHRNTINEIFDFRSKDDEVHTNCEENLFETEVSLQQQRSVIDYADLKTTEPRPVISAGMKLRVRDPTSRRNKIRRKRDYRRSRNPKPTDFLSPNQNKRSKIPNNTSWTKVPQAKNATKCDYNQGRRWSKLLEKTKHSNDVEDIYADEGSNNRDSLFTECVTLQHCDNLKEYTVSV